MIRLSQRSIKTGTTWRAGDTFVSTEHQDRGPPGELVIRLSQRSIKTGTTWRAGDTFVSTEHQDRDHLESW